MQKMNYIVFDLETTGVDILVDEPIQIFLGVAGGKEEEIGDSLFFKCYGERRISQEAENVHKISWEELLKEGIPAREGVGRILHFTRFLSPKLFVGHNATSFDLPMLWNWLQRYGKGKFRLPAVCGVYDTMHMANAVLGGTKWRRLENLAMELGIPLPSGDLHDAREDGMLTWKIFQKLEERRKEKGI